MADWWPQYKNAADEIRRLRTALKWYADEMNWVEDGGHTSAAVEDGGKIARSTVEQSQKTN